MGLPHRQHTAAHPRSRGENGADPVVRWTQGGSSPLTRGKLDWDDDGVADHGLIPAHAGKMMTQAAPGDLVWAHPRSRGENPDEHFTAFGRVGSSPLTRGKHRPTYQRWSTRRLIPAHAGKTGEAVERGAHPEAHPRSRGENPVQTVNQFGDLGSSPLTRGKRPRRPRQGTELRLIPAHAGKTFSYRAVGRR